MIIVGRNCLRVDAFLSMHMYYAQIPETVILNITS